MPSREAMQIAEQWTRDNSLTMTPRVDALARSIDELRVRDLERELSYMSYEMKRLRNEIAALKSTTGDKGRTA